MKSPLYLRIRLSTLIWMMTAVCCFYAGTQWNNIENLKRGTDDTITIEVQKSFILTMEQRIPEIELECPGVVRANAINPYQLMLCGSAAGETIMNVKTEDGEWAKFSVIVLPNKPVISIKKRHPAKSLAAIANGDPLF